MGTRSRGLSRYATHGVAANRAFSAWYRSVLHVSGLVVTTQQQTTTFSGTCYVAARRFLGVCYFYCRTLLLNSLNGRCDG